MGKSVFQICDRRFKDVHSAVSVGQIIKDPKPLYTALSNAGGNMMAPQAQAELRNRTQNYHAKPSFTVATRIGWHGLAYVFPNQIVGKPPLRIEKSFGDIDPQMQC